MLFFTKSARCCWTIQPFSFPWTQPNQKKTTSRGFMTITFFRVDFSGKRRWRIATAILKPCTRRCWRRTPSSSYHRCRPRWAEEGEAVVGGRLVGCFFILMPVDAMHVFFWHGNKYGRTWCRVKTRTISTCCNKQMFKSDINFLKLQTYARWQFKHRCCFGTVSCSN